MRDSAVIGGCYGELRQVLYDMYGGRSYTASKRVEIFHRAISQPGNFFGHGSEEATFEAFPRLLRQRGDFLWMQHVLQVMHEMQATRNFWECHMLEVEGDVRKCAPGIWSD